MLYAFLWVIPRRLKFIYQRFGTPCLFCLHRRVGIKNESLMELGPEIVVDVGEVQNPVARLP
jgi:hypothetical protein